MPDPQEDQKIHAEDATKEILKQAEHDLPEDEQVKLGKPLADDSGVSPEDVEFLEMLVNKIENKKLDLFVPSSLLNTEVYDTLDEETQGKADFNALNLLSPIRQIYKLWQAGERESYQIQNLVHQVRITKERLEKLSGDIYII